MKFTAKPLLVCHAVRVCRSGGRRRKKNRAEFSSVRESLSHTGTHWDSLFCWAREKNRHSIASDSCLRVIHALTRVCNLLSSPPHNFSPACFLLFFPHVPPVIPVPHLPPFPAA